MQRQRLEKILVDIGFSDKEARVYLACLHSSGEAITKIAQEAGVKRPTTYLILEQLRQKGFINLATKLGRERYYAVNPNAVLKEVSARQAALQAVLPDLLKLHHSHELSPHSEIFVGASGMAEILKDTLKAKSGLCGWCLYRMEEDELDYQFLPEYVRARIKNKIMLRSIMPFQRRLKKELIALKAEDPKSYRDVCFVPEEDYPLTNELLIYNDKIAVLCFEHSAGLVIQNEYLSATTKMAFEIAFKYAKLSEPDILSV
jgi:HTH-type transcriptional regulator, sugar sensing transcriptional regulator